MRRTTVSLIVILVLALSIAGCGKKETVVMTSQDISPLAQEAAQKGVDFTIETDDFRSVAGTFYNAGAERSAILLHMMNKDRTSWDNFIPILINAGYNVVAMDLRGHGLSEGDWQDLGKPEFMNTDLDARAAKRYLEQQGISGDMLVIGASIGANAALKYAVTDEDVKQIVLLSPGLDYRGLTTNDVVADYKGGMLIVVSENDVYARQSGTELYTSAAIPEAQKKYIQYGGKAHGTDMFEENPLADDMIEWLKEQ